MPRYKIANEREPITLGDITYVFDAGSLRWDSNASIPISKNVIMGYLGEATDIRREADGSITAEIPFNVDVEISEFSIELSEVVIKHGKIYQTLVNVVETARIRHIFLVPIPGYPRSTT